MTRMCHHTTCVLEWMHAGDHEYESAAAAPSLPAAAGEPEIPRVNVRDVKPWSPSDRWYIVRSGGMLTHHEKERYEATVQRLESTIATLRSTLEARKQQVKEALAAHSASFGALVDVSLMTDLGGEVDDYSEVAKSVERALAAREQRIGELTRPGQRTVTDAEIGAYEATVESLRAELASREARIGELEKEVEQLRSRITSTEIAT